MHLSSSNVQVKNHCFGYLVVGVRGCRVGGGGGAVMCCECVMLVSPEFALTHWWEKNDVCLFVCVSVCLLHVCVCVEDEDESGASCLVSFPTCPPAFYPSYNQPA